MGLHLGKGRTSSTRAVSFLLSLVSLVSAIGCGTDSGKEEVEVDGEKRVIEKDGPCPLLLAPGLKAGRDVDCGHVVSPLDHERQGGGSLRVAYFRVKAKDGKGKRPPLLFHFGGPGDDGSQPARVAMALRDTLGKDRDLIAIGQRGTTFSLNFPDCADTPQSPGAEVVDVVDLPTLVQATKTQAHACKKAMDDAGLDIRKFDTTSGVKDVEALRLGLGYGRIALHGISYGSTFAMEYARKFPDSVHALILDSILAPDYGRQPYFIDQYADILGYLTVWRDKICPTAPECASAFQGLSIDFPALYDTVLATSSQSALNPVFGVSLRSIDIMGLSRSAGMDPTGRVLFTFFVHGLSRLTGEFTPSGIDTGLYDSFSRFLPMFNRGAAEPKTVEDLVSALLGAGEGGGGFSVGFNTALGCAEIFSTNQDEVKTLLGQEPYATLSEGFKSTVMALSSLHHARCEPWDGIQKERLKTFGRKFESSVPALLINSAFDSATPFKYAEAASKSFRKGVLVKVGCTAHGTVLGGPSPETLACAASILRDVLDQGPSKVDPECLCAE